MSSIGCAKGLCLGGVLSLAVAVLGGCRGLEPGPGPRVPSVVPVPVAPVAVANRVMLALTTSSPLTTEPGPQRLLLRFPVAAGPWLQQVHDALSAKVAAHPRLLVADDLADSGHPDYLLQGHCEVAADGARVLIFELWRVQGRAPAWRYEQPAPAAAGAPGEGSSPGQR